MSGGEPRTHFAQRGHLPTPGPGLLTQLMAGCTQASCTPQLPVPQAPHPFSSPTFRLLPSHHTDTPLISVSTQTDYGILTSLPLNAAELRHHHNKWVTILTVIYLPIPQSQLRTHFHVEVILSLDFTAIKDQLNIN